MAARSRHNVVGDVNGKGPKGAFQVGLELEPAWKYILKKDASVCRREERNSVLVLCNLDYYRRVVGFCVVTHQTSLGPRVVVPLS